MILSKNQSGKLTAQTVIVLYLSLLVSCHGGADFNSQDAKSLRNKFDIKGGDEAAELGSDDEHEPTGEEKGETTDSGPNPVVEPPPPADDDVPGAPVTPVTPGPSTQPVIPTCMSKSPRSGLTDDGYVEFLQDGYKPGLLGQLSATEGLLWANGGTAKGWGTGPNILDWRLCSKLSFHERGHSLTRTINFHSPEKDGVYSLRIHRVRSTSESFGVGIWYHWDKRVKWQGPALSTFNAHKDYIVACTYTKLSDSFLCKKSEAPLRAYGCSKYRGPCTEIKLKP